jgi:chemotaxis protein MotB
MRQRQRLLAKDDNLQHIWPSFADVTTTFAMLLFVLVLIAYVKNLVSGKQLAAYEKQIAGAEQRLGALSLDLDRTQKEISLGRSALSASERKLKTQEGVIAASQTELDALRARLSSIALLRVEVLEKVKQSIEAVLAKNPPPPTPGAPATLPGAPLVRLGDNGNIVINEGLVFEYNSFALKPTGTPLLDTLSRALEGVLDDAEVREYVDTIVVQGHTDDRGTSSFNRELSSKRANAVLDYVFKANPTLEQKYASYFASSAFSEFRPLDPEETETAYERNRRIEISVVLKDANVRKLIDQYMQATPIGVDPGATAPNTAGSTGVPGAPGDANPAPAPLAPPAPATPPPQ